jgi:hypothetical protein
MALTINAADSCTHLFAIINYSSSQAVDLTLKFQNQDGANISGGLNPLFNISPNSAPISYPIPVNSLSITNGVIDIILETVNGGNEIDRQAVLLHCDIDCCLTKLTNELIDCECDCAKCADSLAKAQKVFLLLQSADYAIVQANDAASGVRPGFMEDANNKYLKAKEVCDETCGCNC